MQRLLTSLALLVTTSALFAQNCPDRTLGTNLGGGDDVVFGIQPIGFLFPFGGTTYTDVHVCCNGYLSLSNAGVPPPLVPGDYSATAAELAAGTPRICALWNDLNVVVANGAGVYINSTAAKCTITWDRAVNYGLTMQFQVQVQLFPSGEVMIFYSPGTTNNSTYNYVAGVGLAGVSPGGGVALPAASDLSAGGLTADNTLFEFWAVQTTCDLAGKSLHLIPTNPGWVFVASLWSGCAETSNYGSGCISARDSFFELMPVGGFDLANTTMTLLRTPTGYTAVNSIPGTIVPPTGAAVIVANADDIVQTVALASAMPVPGGTTSFLSISSNGNIALAGTGNGAGFAPEVGNFLAFAQTAIAPSFHDYNPAIAGSGKIFYEQVGNIAYVTWNDVFAYLTTLPDKFQVQFDRTTGDVTIVYGSFSMGSNNYLVGYSVAGPSPRPEASDLSVALGAGIVVRDAAVLGLTLTGKGLPSLGSVTFSLDTSNVPNIIPLAFLFFGDTPLPGIDLAFLGAANCRAYTNANLTSLTFPVALPAGTGSQFVPIPGSAGLIGSLVTCQSVAFTLANALNLVTSNGTSFTVGL